MKLRNVIIPTFGFLTATLTINGPAWSKGCSDHLDVMEQALEESDLATEQLQPMRDDLGNARRAADGGDEDGCSAVAAKVISAMLQTDGINHEAICDRTQSEDDIGEADMAGNQDVKSALQTSCPGKE